MRHKLALCILFALGANLLNAQNGINFDGGNDVVLTNYGGVLGNANRTFEAWVYVSSSAPASNLAILDYGLNAVGSRNTFSVTGNRGLTFISGGTNANIGTSPNEVPVDQWTHVAFVLNSGTGFLYVNGVQVGTGSLTTVNTPSGSGTVRIGQRVSGGSIPFHGSIDEVRIWNVARTISEIQADMNNELCNGSPNLMLYMQMNQGIAGGANAGLTSVTDLSGNGMTGTMSGFALTGGTSNWVTGATLTAGMNGSSTQLSACNSYTWSANNMTYTSSGIYAETLTNGAGCDSFTVLDLTINVANDLTTDVTECDTFVWSVNGQVYTQSTVVVETLTNSFGCQYDHTLNLIIGTSSAGSETVDACTSYTWAANGLTYSMSGAYTATLTNASGCDSMATLNLTIQSVDNSVTDNGDLSITSNDPNATYQWLDCDNNYAIIAGATSQTFTATTNGNYAVEVSNGVCVDTSACTLIDYVGVEEFSDHRFRIYPNPSRGVITIEWDEPFHGIVELSDLRGRVLRSQSYSQRNSVLFPLEVEAGVYLLRLVSEGKVLSTRRVIKQ